MVLANNSLRMVFVLFVAQLGDFDYDCHAVIVKSLPLIYESRVVVDQFEFLSEFLIFKLVVFRILSFFDFGVD